MTDATTKVPSLAELRAMRKAKGLRQEDVAALAQVSESYVKQLEGGRNGGCGIREKLFLAISTAAYRTKRVADKRRRWNVSCPSCGWASQRRFVKCRCVECDAEPLNSHAVGLCLVCFGALYARPPKALVAQPTIGRVFGLLTVIEKPFRLPGRQAAAKCRCACGSEVVTRTARLIAGTSVSCGCANRHLDSVHSDITKEYMAWRGIIDRCTRITDPAWRNYGGRGIKVCAAWRASYTTFLGDVGRAPSPEHSIDRINNDGDYEPGNVRWATKRQQMFNRRNTRKLTVGGETKNLAEWSDATGLPRLLIYGRLKREGEHDNIFRGKHIKRRAA